MPEQSLPKTVLGVDFGTVRIGVAVANTVTGISTPESVIYGKPNQIDWDSILKVIKAWQPGLLVVGMPSKLDGSASVMQEPILKFCRELEQRSGLPVQTVSEQLSSREAEERLKAARQAGRKRKIRKEDIDQLAAAIILDSWLLENARGQP